MRHNTRQCQSAGFDNDAPVYVTANINGAARGPSSIFRDVYGRHHATSPVDELMVSLCMQTIIFRCALDRSGIGTGPGLQYLNSPSTWRHKPTGHAGRLRDRIHFPYSRRMAKPDRTCCRYWPIPHRHVAG